MTLQYLSTFFMGRPRADGFIRRGAGSLDGKEALCVSITITRAAFFISQLLFCGCFLSIFVMYSSFHLLPFFVGLLSFSSLTLKCVLWWGIFSFLFLFPLGNVPVSVPLLLVSWDFFFFFGGGGGGGGGHGVCLGNFTCFCFVFVCLCVCCLCFSFVHCQFPLSALEVNVIERFAAVPLLLSVTARCTVAVCSSSA